MREKSLWHYLSLLLILSCNVSFSFGSRSARLLASSSGSPKVKAVNLGGWLVTEGWIKPSLFDGIPNNDTLDGTQIQLKSVTQQMYLSAESGGGTIIVANRTIASGWETFKLWRINESTFNFRVFNWQFIGLSSNGKKVVATATSPSTSETFQIIRNLNTKRIRIKAPNGLFIQAKTAVSVTADYTKETTNWGNDDPSVFEMTFVVGSKLQGEFQLTNGYGPGMAETVLKKHWDSFITEDDFRSIAKSGLNAVRIPVGWWIASGQNPPKPFVGGSLQVLDRAFGWAEKYQLQVIVDLHAVIHSQNGFEHSGSRDGFIGWGSDESIAQTVAVIDFLASKYGKRSSLLAIELMNEPNVAQDSLKKYYEAGHGAVRKHTSNAYVIMSNRLVTEKPTELLQFARGFDKSVIDVHYYNLFSDGFKSMTVQEHINYVNNDRAQELKNMMITNGPLVFVGEWTGEFGHVRDPTMKDYQRFTQAELNVFGRASFGWGYWSWKIDNEDHHHWSLQWMINNGIISLN